MKDAHVHLENGPLTKAYVLEFIYAGIEKGLDEIQILDHTHRFKEFRGLYENLKNYEIQKQWLENTDKKFKDKLEDFILLMEEIKCMDLPIKVYYGLEVCYVPECEEFIRNIVSKYHFDFLVGAIHSIDGILYDMPFSKELLWNRYCADYIYKRYYDLVFLLIQSGLFTQLAHPDTIKLFQIYPSYDLHETYHTLAKLLVKYHMKAENNVGCYYRYHHPDKGLSQELLCILKDYSVEIVTASDAHYPCDVGRCLDEL